MPDFDKDLNPILPKTSKELPVLDNPAFNNNFGPTVPIISPDFNADLAGKKGTALDRFFGSRPVTNRMSPTVSAGELYDNRRYGTYSSDIVDIEDQKAYAQSNLDKATNGVLKGLNLTATTVAGGFGMLYGLAKSPFTGKISSIWNNEITNKLDDWNTKVDQEYLPNYYTNIEKDASWWHTDNWFKTNFLFDKLVKNSGFAVGAMLSGNIANAGLIRAGAGIGAAALEASQGFKLFTPLLRNTARAFSQGKNIEAAQALESGLSSIADIAQKTSELAKIAKTTSAFTDFGDFSRRSLIALYSSAGESSWEALGTQRRFRENLIEEYKKENNGVDPSGEALQRIDKEASDVGLASFLGNMALLSVTEYAQLPKLLGSSYAAEKQAANSLLGRADDVIIKDGKYIAKTSPYSLVRGSSFVLRGGKYVFDPKEMGQEFGQYALEVGVQNYYNKALKSQDASAYVDGFLYGLFDAEEGALRSKEGIESGVLGGLTGGIMQTRSNYLGNRAVKTNTGKFVDRLNNTPSAKEAFKDRLNSANRGIVLQEQQQNATINGDKLEAKDLETDQMFNYLSTRIKYGRYDMVKEDVKDIREQLHSTEGLAKLKEEGLANINDTKESFSARLDILEKSADNINDIYKSLNLRYSGVIDKDGNRVYTPTILEKMAYAAFKVTDYDNRMISVAGDLIKGGVTTPMVTEAVLAKETIQDEARLQEAVIDALQIPSDKKEDLKTLFSHYAEMAVRRKTFLEEYESIKESPANFTATKGESDIDLDNLQQQTTIQTPTGELVVAAGDTFVVSKSQEEGELEGVESFKVLGEKDGKITIVDNKGNVKEISKDTLISNDLLNAKELAKSPNARLFNETRDQKFIFTTGRDKEAIEGTLSYDAKSDRLTFTSTDGSKVYTVTRDQFNAKRGKEAAIVAVSDLSEEAKKALGEEVSENEIAAKYEQRYELITTVVEQAKKDLAETRKKINAARKQVQKADAVLKEQIQKTLTKKGQPKKRVGKVLRDTIDNLAMAKNNAEQIVESLEKEKSTLEQSIAYLKDLLTNKEELPDNFKQVAASLKQDVEELEEVIQHTNQAIKDGKSWIKELQSALEYALNALKEYIQDFRDYNPNLPINVEALQERVERFLGEKGAEQYIAERLGFTEEVMSIQEDIQTYENNELKIPDIKNKIQKLQAQVAELEQGLDAVEKEHNKKEVKLEALNRIAAEYDRVIEEARVLAEDAETAETLIETLETGTQTSGDENLIELDTKKDLLVVPNATKVPSKAWAEAVGEEYREHHVRANLFASKVDGFANRQAIKGIIVTSANEKQYLPGLTAHLKGKSDAKAEEIIAFVIVEEQKDGSLKLVGVDGKVLDKPTVNNAIYQVFPDKGLTWKNGTSMFRVTEDTGLTKTITAEYGAWRDNVLANTPKKAYTFQASAGHPIYSEILDDKGEVIGYNYTSAESAGLITEDDLSSKNLVEIPTLSDTVSKNGVTFKAPVGVPILNLPSGYVGLKNSKLSGQQAETIYQVLVQVAKLAQTGRLKEPEAKRLFNWLKSTVYWGTPREGNTGYNSIWFTKEDGKLVLKMSTDETTFRFTPIELANNKAVVIAKLETLYTNVHKAYTTAETWNERYEEIIGIDKEGNPIVRMVDGKPYWPNYQTYLLSQKGRKPDEIPLRTRLKPLQSDTDVNRDGIYFYVTDNDTTYTNVVASKPTVLTPIGTPPPVVNKLTPTTPDTAVVVADGKTKNQFVTGSGYLIEYTAIPNTNGFKIDIVPSPNLQLAVQAVADKLGKTLEEAAQIIVGNLKYIVGTAASKQQQPENKQPLEEKPKLTPTNPETFTVVADGKTENVYVTQAGFPFYFTTDGKNIKGLSVDKNKKSFEEFAKTQASPEVAAKIIENNVTVLVQMWNAKQKADVTPLTITEADVAEMNEQKEDIDDDDEPFRLQLIEEAKKYEGENWEKLAAWLKSNFPNVPVYRVKNVIKATNGRQAWGMFKNGAIYLYESAEVGTAYHEVFEAVWKSFVDVNEKAKILEEFGNREGTFFDRVTLQDVKYSEATPLQRKERLAEEFRSYIKEGTKPPKPTKGKSWVAQMFSDLVTFIKTFFTGKAATTNTMSLFKKIGSGYYKSKIINETGLSFAKKGYIDIEDAFGDADAEYSLMGLTETQVHEVMQQMTYKTLSDINKDDKSWFVDIQPKSKKEHYAMLKKNVQTTVLQKAKYAESSLERKEITAAEAQTLINQSQLLWKAVTVQWDEIQRRHEEVLRTYNIVFDENDNLSQNEEKGKDETYQSADKIDYYKKLPFAAKLLFSTVPVLQKTEKNVDGAIVSSYKAKQSSIGGAILLSTSEVYAKIHNAVNGFINTEDMLERIRQLALQDINYRTIYKRLTRFDPIPLPDKPTMDWSILKDHHSQMFAILNKTFKRNNADVKNLYVYEDGNAYVGEANFASAVEQVASSLEGALVKSILDNRDMADSYFTYSKKEKVFKGKKGILKDLKLTNNTLITKFLDKFGISFTVEELDNLQKANSKVYKAFVEGVNGIKKTIDEGREISTVNKKILSIDNRLRQIAQARVKISNPEFDVTHYGVDGERRQTFLGTNVVSDLYDQLASISKLSELAGTPYAYLLTDSFVKYSTILRRMFNKNGDRIDDSENLMKASIAGGTANKQTGKDKNSSELTYKERLVQELNMNLQGYYYTLVPGDANIEAQVYMGNEISEKDIVSGDGTIHEVFQGYLLSEALLSLENRPIKEIKTRSTNDLRFFKAILGKELHDEIVKELHKLEDKSEKSVEQFLKVYTDRVNTAVTRYINTKAIQLEKTLTEYGIVSNTLTEIKDSEGQLQEVKDSYTIDNIDLGEKNMSKDYLFTKLKRLSANYAIANIELHKLLFSDPYQYSDELKRIKNFLSPRQPIISRSSGMNSLLNRVWNKGYKKGDVGRTDMLRDHFNTATLSNVFGILQEMEEYTPFDKTDGSGIIQMKGYRNLRIRSGDWNLDNEKQYRYDIAWYKQHKKLELSKEEADLLEEGNPGVMSTYTPLKPIVAGNKMNGKSYNDLVLDKFALYPLSYRIIYEINPTANALKLFDKMIEQDIDYVVFESGRKVGAGESHSLYNKGGEYNNSDFAEETISKIPYSIISIQAEVPSKDTDEVTKGSQVTKLATLDMMDAGVPVDYKVDKTWEERYKAWLLEEDKLTASPLYAKIKHNEEILKQLINNGYVRLLDRLGIVEKEDGKYEIADIKKAGNLLREEMTKREVNINMSKALQGFLNGDVLLEATPAYQQIRNILYSIADSEIVSQSMTGGLKVQIPSVLLESEGVTHKVAKNDKGEDVDTYTSNELKFYNTVDEKTGKKRVVCEIMLAPWFSIPTDETKKKELLNYLNNTAEGQKILSGIAYRIPTQKQNSIDAFVIKKFLPKEFGDSVVIPEALVKKSGSDFDIDKLSIYFKSIYYHGKFPKVVPYFGKGEQAKQKFGELFEEILADKKEKVDITLQRKEELLTLMELMNTPNLSNKKQKFLDQQSDFLDKFISGYGNVGLDEIIEDLTKATQFLGDKLYELSDDALQDLKKEMFIEKMYKKSIENEYITSLTDLVTSEYNIPNMVKPNSADQLKKLAGDVSTALGFGSFDYQEVGNMLDRRFMSRLRHAFITGKYAIGIAAVNQTNHSLNQRSVVYIDPAKIEDQDPQVATWLGDGSINLPHNTVEIDGKTYATLSRITSKGNNDMISDILSQFIDGYVDISKGPWIIEMGATPNVASTFMFLVKVGVPIDTVVYFMNQPIIRDYLRNIENDGYSWLFMAQYVKEIIQNPKYSVEKLPEGADYKKDMPSTTRLKKAMGQQEFTTDEKLEQQFILSEFLKYAGMASQLFNVTQGSNFDTTSFNDPYLIFKKLNQLKKAQNSIISSVDGILESSFLGELKGRIEDMRDAIAELLVSDKGVVRDVIERVLEPYTDMSDRDFLKIARKVVNDVFDWAVQTNPAAREGFTTALNTEIQTILTGDKSAAKQLYDFFETVKKDKTHPLHGNVVVHGLEMRPSGYVNGVDNLKFTNKDNKIYDQNQIIAGFQELKQHFSIGDGDNLYNMLVTLAVLQSGLSTSPISFTSLLPYEDFKNIYNRTLASLEGQDVEAFYTLRVFERNNWNNPDIVPQLRARPVLDQRATSTSGFAVYEPNPNMAWLPKKVIEGLKEGAIPLVMSVGMGRESQSEFITYTWYDRTKVNEDGKRVRITPKMRAEMAAKGDFSYIRKGLFRRVMHEGKPFSFSKKGGRPYYMYKLTDGWGDGFRANEFYKDLVPSVLDNRLTPNGNRAINRPSENSEDDVHIVQRVEASFTKKDKYVSQGSLPSAIRSVYMSDDNAFKLLKGQKTSTIRSNREAENIGIPVGKTEVRYVNGTAYNFTNKGLLTIDEAGGKEKLVLSEGLPTTKEGSNIHPIAVKGKTYYSMFKQTQNWMNGSGKMFVYNIQPVEGVIEPTIVIEEVQPEERGKSLKSLKSMDAKALYSEINKLDDPTDATGLALQYLAGGGKIGTASLYNEVISKRDARLVTQKAIKEEANARDYVDKYGPTIKDAAHGIWDNLPEYLKDKIEDQEIRDALIDAVSTYNKRFDAATAYFEKYGPQEEKDPFTC